MCRSDSIQSRIDVVPKKIFHIYKRGDGSAVASENLKCQCEFHILRAALQASVNAGMFKIAILTAFAALEFGHRHHPSALSSAGFVMATIRGSSSASS